MSTLRKLPRHFTRLLQRKSKIVIVFTFLLTIIFCLHHYTSSTNAFSQVQFDPETSYSLPPSINSPLKDFYSSLMTTLIEMSPEGESEKKYSDDCKLKGALDGSANGYKTSYKATFDNLNNCLEIPDDKLQLLREKHLGVTNKINGVKLPDGILRGKGIVIVGGGKYSVLAASNIQILRDFNTTLPVEVFIPPGEDDDQFCNEFLPKYNAKCTHIENILNPEVLNNVKFKGYQYKSLALLSSQFEHILFLDADNFPMKFLDNIFDEVSYKKYSMILWSDFWRRTDSPKYYDIAGIKYNKNKRVRNLFDDITPVEVYTENMNDLKDVPFHDFEGTVPDISTESGQFLINKKIHWKTIVLSLYYNLNGPKWYYPIFSQGAPGEGDKETFASAATVFGLPFYQLRRRPGIGGYHDTSFHGVCMFQENFTVDYNNYLEAKKIIGKKYKDVKPTFQDQDHTILPNVYDTYFNNGEQDVMFVHFNFPKLNPVELSKHHTFIENNGKQHRSISNLKPMGYFDLELNVNVKLKDMICGEEAPFTYVKESFIKPETTKEKVCGYIDTRIKFLSDTHKEATTPK